MKFEQRDLFGGSGRVEVVDLLAGRPFQPFHDVLACALEPGGRVGAHRQEQCPEIVVVTEGQGVAVVDGQRHPVGPGSVVLLPLGSSLELHNTDAQRWLRYVIVKA